MYLSIGQALAQGTKLLEEAGVGAPRLTAEVLLARALGKERSYLFAHPEEPLTQLAWIHYGRYLHQRREGTPTQYVTGVQEFYGREFCVREGVLIPRPETEHLVEAALARLGGAERILDLGTGSGCVAVTLALELRRAVVAIERYGEALAVAQRNVAKHRAPVRLVQGDFLEPFADGSLEAIVTNPPYVPARDKDTLPREVLREPASALFGGEDGLEAFRRLRSEGRRVLEAGGWLLAEIGFGQQEAVRELFATGWKDVSFTPDLAGIPRVLAARRG